MALRRDGFVRATEIQTCTAIVGFPDGVNGRVFMTFRMSSPPTSRFAEATN